MEEKIIITAELSKNDVSAIFFLTGRELTDEVWKKLSESPIQVDFSQLERTEQQQMKLLLASMALASIK